ncbi:MAG TPA: hypothetical protein VD886_19510 [Herpetosiphonaceae bacterium]|nr:hypothetical protein [Herpetosiphonaceae bacterium]
MAFIDYFVPLRRAGQKHRSAILMFGGTLGLLITGELCLRQVLDGRAAPDPALLAAALLQPLGLLGMGCILAATLLWAMLLVRHQLSFFYPLWGLATLALMLAHWIAAGSLDDPRALFGALLVLAGAGLLARGGHSR